MRYNDFGSTGVKVSALSLGTWGIGGAGWDYNPDDTKLETIRTAIDEGVTCFDTAPAYNAGAAERLLGEAVKASGKRDELFLVTKCGNDFIDGQYVRDARPELLLKQIDKSLANLQTDYIDLYILHWPDPNVPAEDVYGTMAKIKEQGKVRFIGVSNHNREQLDKARAVTTIDAIQLQYSMLVRDNEELLKYAHEEGLATMGYGPLGGGILSGRYRTLTPYEEMDNRNRFYQYFKEPGFSKAMALLAVIDEIAKAHGSTPSEVTLAWTAQKDFLSTVLFGTQKKERLTENLKAFDRTLTDDEVKAIDDAIKEHIA